MGGKIPQPVRLEVIKRWLEGYSRDEIAKDTRIGAGTVSGIIQQCRQDDADFDLLRGVAVELGEGHASRKFCTVAQTEKFT